MTSTGPVEGRVMDRRSPGVVEGTLNERRPDSRASEAPPPYHEVVGNGRREA
jgi:hypothetical protein